MPQEKDDQSFWELLKLSDKSERDRMMADVLGLTLSWQVRALRQSRGWTLEETAARSGLRYQTVRRLEQPDEVLKTSVNTLLTYAKAFDVGLIVRMTDWKIWLEAMLTREAFVPAPFDADKLAAMAES